MPTISELFPDSAQITLTAKGKDFLERIGIEASRKVILGVLCGENIRSQTEPLTRRRLTIVSAAMIKLFANGWAQDDDFSKKVSKLAIDQLNSSGKNDKINVWPSNWIIGLTGKGFQNILRSDRAALNEYIIDFEKAIYEAAEVCKMDFGPLNLALGYIKDDKEITKVLDWVDLARMSTAIGAATLTIRGSDKSTYGKLFEHLVLGSVLSILGFEYTKDPTEGKIDKVFWLSDSSDLRECDGTIRIRAGKLARFDIGFIGKGNPEIMKDKLSRYAREVEQNGIQNTSRSFIIVDRMPNTLTTSKSAEISEAEIVQMSMQYWPKELALRLQEKLNYESEILAIPDEDLSQYLNKKMNSIQLEDFINGVEFD